MSKTLVLILISVLAISHCKGRKVIDQSSLPMRNDVPDQKGSTPENGDTSKCPTSTVEWDAWRLNELKHMSNSFFKTNGAFIQDQLLNCRHAPQLVENSGRCFEHLNSFTHRIWLGKQSHHLLGLDIEDSAYLKVMEGRGYLTLPDHLRSQDFLARLDQADSNNIRDFEEWLRGVNNKWRVFYYRSRNLPTIDDSQAKSRLFVYIPEDGFDRFIQFGIKDNQTSPLSESISEIIIEKHPDQVSTQKVKPTAYYADLWRVRKSGEIKISTRISEVKTAEPCYSCHEATLLKIIPEAGSLTSPASKRDLNAVNQLIKSYATANVSGLNREDLGPAIGLPPGNSETAMRARSCIESAINDPKSIRRVEDAMNCAACHNGSTHATLHYLAAKPGEIPPDHNLLSRAILDDQTMPPGVDLTLEERHVLYDCLVKQMSSPEDLKGDLEDWLLQRDCRA